MPKDPEVSRLTVYQLSCPHRIYWYTDDGNGAQGGHPSLAYRSFSSGAGKKQLASWLKNHVYHTKVGYKKLPEAWHTYKLKGSKGQRWSLPFGICLACWISHAILSWWSCSDYVTYIMYKLYSDLSILNTYIYIYICIYTYILFFIWPIGHKPRVFTTNVRFHVFPPSVLNPPFHGSKWAVRSFPQSSL